MLTNFSTIKKSIKHLKNLEKMSMDGTYDSITKKEILRIERKREKLEKSLGGIKDMNRLPGGIFIVDTKKESIAVAEANKLNVPIFGILDTNCDPEEIDFPIPGNDDAIRSIRLFSHAISDTVIETQREIASASKEKEADDTSQEESETGAVA